MTTSVREDRELPLTVAQVLDVLRSPAHWAARVRDAGEGRLELTGLEVSETGVEATLAGPVPLDWLPAVVRARMSAPPSIRRVERWTAVADGPGGRATALSGVLDFAVAGVSATVAGTGAVRPTPAGSRIVVDLTVGVDLPFIGGLIEQAIATQIGPNLARELALIGP